MAHYLVLLLLTATVGSELLEPKKRGFEDTFYSLVDAMDEASFRIVLKDYSDRIRNESVDPCDNFYEYACGNWANVAKLEGVKDYSVPHSVFYGTNYVLFKLLSENVTLEDEPPVVVAKKFFQTCTNISSWNTSELINFAESFGPWPLTSDSWSSLEFDWINAIAWAHAYSVKVLFKQSFGDQNIARKFNVFQPLEKSAVQNFWKTKKVSNSGGFVREIKKVFKKNGVNLGGKEEMIAEVYNFEKRLQLLPSTVSEAGNLKLFEISEVNDIFGNNFLFQYLKVLRGKRVRTPYTVLVKNRVTLAEAFSFINEVDDRVIANDIYVNFVLSFLEMLEAVKKDIIEKCAGLVKELYSEAALLMFTKRYYDNGAEEVITEMVKRILDAAQTAIEDSEWMTEQTRSLALLKLAVVDQRIAFNKTRYSFESQNPIYSAIEVEEGNPVLNLLRACRHRVLQDQSVTPGSIWLHEPFTVNAAFASGLSIMSIPFGILQPPIFHKFSPPFSNYGSLGTIVGHELMHGFDHNGIKFDSMGRISEWFDPRLKFDYFTKLGCYLRQYDKHQVSGLNATVDGAHTLGENVADNQGFEIALKAYMNLTESFYEDSGRNEASLNNLQVFFLSYAQSWCSVSTAGSKSKSLATDVHAPGEVRVLKVLSNSQDFAEAFKCPVGSKMNPVLKCRYLRK